VDLTQFGLFDLADQRLRWAAQRQEVLAQNIANANTPGFRARDLTSFARLLAATPAATPAQTASGHLPGTLGGRLQATAVRPQNISPDRNDVSMEAELSKVADTETAQQFAAGIYRKYMSLFRLALGRGQ
jgi:flagellar basal-body rod protein FlgB